MHAYTTRLLKDKNDTGSVGLPGFASVIVRPVPRLLVIKGGNELLDKEVVCCLRATD